jgi:hypothetical protein
MVYKESENLSGLKKITLIKTSVKVLVLLSIAQELIGKFGKGICLPFSGSCTNVIYDTQRAYCVLVLIIFDALALVFYQAFAVPLYTQSTFNAYPESDMSFCRYFCEIFKFWDVMGLIVYNGDGEVSKSSSKV